MGRSEMSTGTGTDNAYKRIIGNISHKLAYVAAALILAMMMLTVADVFLRYFFNAPINGTYEITELMMVLVFAPTLAWTAMRGANVRVDLLVGRFPNRVQGAFDSATCLLSLFVTGVITWFTVPQAMFVYRIKTVSDQLEIPFYPFFIVIAVGFFLLIFALVSNLIDFLTKAVKG
jgi:TRAP-type C4-dicarboxylate transport system permease small subunit